METLESLIERYALNKNELDAYEKLCNKDNSEIKRMMLDDGLDTFISKNYSASISKAKRETFDEDKLIDVLKTSNLKSVIKTKEYVDMDALESAIYNGKVPNDVLIKMNDCKNIKEVITLRVSRKRGE